MSKDQITLFRGFLFGCASRRDPDLWRFFIIFLRHPLFHLPKNAIKVSISRICEQYRHVVMIIYTSPEE